MALFKWIEKHESSPLFVIGMLLSIFLIGGSVVGVFYYFKNAEEERVEAFNQEELLIYNLNETDYESSQIDYIDEYIDLNSLEDLMELEKRFNNDDFSFLKDQYNNALEYKYFDEDSVYVGNITTAIEDSKNGESRFTSTAIEQFLNINRQLLTPELEKKIYISGTQMILVREDAADLAQQAEWDRKSEERKIYQVMKSTFDDITNYGENYIPEVHDDIVAQAASNTFGISIGEANRIYIDGEMGEY